MSLAFALDWQMPPRQQQSPTPFFPQFKESSLEVAREAEAAGATDAKAVAAHVARRLKSKGLELAVDDPDDPENWPRVWLIWRGNAIMASAKGHEFFLRHYLDAHGNSVAEENAKDKVKSGSRRIVNINALRQGSPRPWAPAP